MTTRLMPHGEGRAPATTEPSYGEPGGALVMAGPPPQLRALTSEARRRHATPTPDPDPDPRDALLCPAQTLRSSEPVCLVDRRLPSATRG